MYWQAYFYPGFISVGHSLIVLMFVLCVLTSSGLVGRYQCFVKNIFSHLQGTSHPMMEALCWSKNWYLPIGPRKVKIQKTNIDIFSLRLRVYMIFIFAMFRPINKLTYSAQISRNYVVINSDFFRLFMVIRKFAKQTLDILGYEIRFVSSGILLITGSQDYFLSVTCDYKL